MWTDRHLLQTLITTDNHTMYLLLMMMTKGKTTDSVGFFVLEI